jgi:hypothetical protein
MPQSTEHLASNISPPRRGEIFVVATSTTCARIDLDTSVTPLTPGSAATPGYLYGRYVSVQADGAAVYIALMDNNSTDIVTTATGSPADTGCVLIPDGQTMSFVIEKSDVDHRYLAYRTATGTGYLRVWASSPRIP